MRRSVYIRENALEREVPIIIHPPRPVLGGWECHYDIGWPSNPRSGRIVAYDEIQAMLYAIQNIGIDLYASRYHAEGRLRWVEGVEGYGFPLPRGGRDIMVGIDEDEFGDGPKAYPEVT